MSLLALGPGLMHFPHLILLAGPEAMWKKQVTTPHPQDKD